MKHMTTNQIDQYLEKVDIPTFRDELISWFESEMRDLPWRKNQDPYKVWVSEIMLQQTKVDTVIPYFNRFIDQFPTVHDLAEAEEQQVLKAWEGLGYYSRARNLQNAVREVVTSYEGKVPDDVEQLSSLKGVGPYTQGAILSIAYGQPEPAVDGNVMRVLSRILLIDEDIAKPKTRKIFEALIRELIDPTNPSYFNQGLMELGALVCTPKSPSCLLCPVQEHCEAYKHGRQAELPIKITKKKKTMKRYWTLVIENAEGHVLIEKRPDSGLLANLWQFPMMDLSEIDREFTKQWVNQAYGLSISIGDKLTNITHVFSHLTWELEAVSCKTVEKLPVETDHLRFVSKEEIDEYPFPVSHQKVRQIIIDEK
ncbi:A/G-specific adenine glycosylase [Radiobacillus kanasensis]|uniref:A/G-specific adenine glycosylase n=1 Tax=Radiobacillus kanasensis TaxID=2844358 RepID=UPI001E4543AF|nr:A/G-specific adenine glycosylase [Radiobacillus kanasensis]UFU00069.1 A/G-specific adenine glycosylase [Radiobacillus kanasensis]